MTAIRVDSTVREQWVEIEAANARSARADPIDWREYLDLADRDAAGGEAGDPAPPPRTPSGR